jgi:hypothetical protein
MDMIDSSSGRTSSQLTAVNVLSDFPLFPRLPIEIRSQIWTAALTPRIIRWVRTAKQNVFTASSDPKAFPVFHVCRESRGAALLYGGYKNISKSANPVYFSSSIDYLFFDPGWISRNQPMTDSLNTILPELKEIKKIMVHPHYTDGPKNPTIRFENLPFLEQILVATDEKSIGSQSKFMIGTLADIQTFYKQLPCTKDFTVPYIAVACLGWTGAERRKIHHGDEDGRQLVAVYENDAQMKSHLNRIREEQWRFTQENFLGSRPKLNLKLRRPSEGATNSYSGTCGTTRGKTPYPPAYSYTGSTRLVETSLGMHVDRY